jgi:hypothetical protein
MRDIGVACELHRRPVRGIPDSHEEPLRDVAGCHCELARFLDSCAGSAIEKMIRQPLQINYKKGTIRSPARSGDSAGNIDGKEMLCHTYCMLQDL